MTANINAKTGIAFGYISADALDPDIVHEVLYGNVHSTNLTYKSQVEEFLAEQRRLHADSPIGSNPPYDSGGEFDEEWAADHFNDGIYHADEETVEGIYQGVSYCSSFLGGALNFWILESPFTTNKARRASPCVPNAAILDTLDGNVTGYDVPAEWRRNAN